MHQLLSGRRDHGGFTLIEVLVAAALLAVGILFVSSMFPVGYSNVDAGGEQTEAAILAQDMLEKIKNARWDDVDNFGSCGAGGCSTTAASFSTGSALADANLTEWKTAVQSRVRAGVGTVQVTLFTPSYTPNSRIATVIVSVQFSQGIRGTKTVTMGTRISE
ncbi:MAG TPA: prepilin-type N-terminal cleavage/methylation domain-containing protein [Candidatus Methylomirabilis sp.]|jgi:type IV pilus assembly protein PilV|nr:prepilin-type N-terminal cleavage/methylation domain-containing protein [Candidatus Methylomirabilis sp.]